MLTAKWHNKYFGDEDALSRLSIVVVVTIGKMVLFGLLHSYMPWKSQTNPSLT